MCLSAEASYDMEVVEVEVIEAFETQAADGTDEWGNGAKLPNSPGNRTSHTAARQLSSTIGNTLPFRTPLNGNFERRDIMACEM